MLTQVQLCPQWAPMRSQVIGPGAPCRVTGQWGSHGAALVAASGVLPALPATPMAVYWLVQHAEWSLTHLFLATN